MTLSNDEYTVRQAVEEAVRVRTVKGAKFVGRVTGWYYNHIMKHYGVVVVADHPSFEGAAHVYPAAQVEAIEP